MSSADAAERLFTMSLDESGIIRLVWNRGIAIKQRDARAALNAANDLCSAGTRPLLVDMATTASVDRPARAVFGEPFKPSRIAMLGNSAVDRVIVNFILGINKPIKPIRFFTDEGAALAWLKAGLDGG